VADGVATGLDGERGLETMANQNLRTARNCYIRWGAEGKARQLEQLHAQLRDERGPLQLTTTVEAQQEQLDFATVVKMSQTLSSEIILDKLIETLMQNRGRARGRGARSAHSATRLCAAHRSASHDRTREGHGAHTRHEDKAIRAS